MKIKSIEYIMHLVSVTGNTCREVKRTCLSGPFVSRSFPFGKCITFELFRGRFRHGCALIKRLEFCKKTYASGDLV